MGTDNLFHKRKARLAESLRRKQAKREPYDIVLIVCEGIKTEPNYFRGLRESLRLNNANIIIADKSGGLDPLSLVEFAIGEYRKDPIYDSVYCVLDKDKHTTYANAIDKSYAISLKKGSKFYVIPSIPCFEVWLLLHYVFTTKSFCAAGNDSNGDLVVSELRKYIKDYEKGNKDIFKSVSDKINDAILNAKCLEKFHENSGKDNPSTKVHELVEYLIRLKN
jgi:hypothetical protein